MVLCTPTPSELTDPYADKDMSVRFYAASNAGLSNTHAVNRQAFNRHRIIPRMLVDTNLRDTTTEIWGHKVSAPIGFAPIGINVIYNQAAELPVAKVAHELNLPYCLSTAGSTPISTSEPQMQKDPDSFNYTCLTTTN